MPASQKTLRDFLAILPPGERVKARRALAALAWSAERRVPMEERVNLLIAPALQLLEDGASEELTLAVMGVLREMLIPELGTTRRMRFTVNKVVARAERLIADKYAKNGGRKP